MNNHDRPEQHPGVRLVTFDPSTGLDPLTAPAGSVAADVERYLQRVHPGRLAATVIGSSGVAYAGGRLVATFHVNALGGAA